jgi:hypothetical protein
MGCGEARNGACGLLSRAWLEDQVLDAKSVVPHRLAAYKRRTEG